MEETTTLERPRLSPTLTLWLVIAAGAAILLGIIAVRGDRGRDAATQHPGVGERLTDWSLAPLTGDASSLTSQETDGQVLLVNLWGPWCPVCLVELPHLVELRERLAGQADFRMLSVSCGQGLDEDLESIRAATANYLERRSFNIPTYGDPGAKFRRIMGFAAGMAGYPFTVLVDREGTIRAAWSGYAPGDEVDMERLVKKQLAAPRKTS
jgi:cytochrome c biogenesis protein CcmG/thiol:disulfide interchange protein DsbE